jgi:hypothetical protein
MNESELESMDIAIRNYSGDKKYFTIIPNSVVDTAGSLPELALYVIMKRHAGEDGEYYVSKKKLCKKLKISPQKLNQLISRLIDFGLIENTGNKQINTPGGFQYVRAYSVRDIWWCNNWEYDKRRGVLDGTTLLEGGAKYTPRGVPNVSPKKKAAVKKKNHILSQGAEAPADAPFSLADELKKLENSNRRDWNVIGFILENRKPEILTREQYMNWFMRYMKIAPKLKHYTDAQLVKACDYAKKEYPEIWTGETLLKILTK